MTASEFLSKDDIARLMGDRSSATQMEVVGKLTAQYAAGDDTAKMTGEQSAIAEDIFRVLLAKAEVQMRSMIALNLQQSDKLPPELVKQMANDVAEVSTPILQNSPLLSDKDLVEIIAKTTDEGRLTAIAKREMVSETVSSALVETKVETVVSTLVQNIGASIDDTTFEKIVERHADNPMVVESVMQRGTLPVPVIDKLVSELSTTLRAKMESKYGTLVEMKELRKAFDQSLEITSLKLAGLEASDDKLTRLINHLNEEGKLSPFAALCTADLPLFEVSLAHMLHIPLKNVQLLSKDARGLKAIYLRAGLPESMYDAVWLCMQAIRHLEESGRTAAGKAVPTPYKVMECMREMAMDNPVENLDYIYMMMQKQTRENLRFKTKL